MGEITLTPDGVEVRPDGSEFAVEGDGVVAFDGYLLHALRIDPEFTFGDLLRLLDGGDVGFFETVLGERIRPLLEEARRPAASDAASGIAFLRVYNVHQDGCLQRGFDGWGTWDEPHDRDPGRRRAGPLSVSLTPVNELLDVPLRYDPELVFFNDEDIEEYRTRIDITLVEFLKAIFYDLTFHGSPGERDEFGSELRRRMEAVERGEGERIPADEVFERVRERHRREGRE